jgi:hypothetical protein
MLADFIVLALFSCLGGFLLGRHSTQAGMWPLLQQQQQQLEQQRDSWEHASAGISTTSWQLLQYAALAWQQLRHVLLAIVAAGAKCAAALLALLAAKASNAAAAVSDAAAAAHTQEQSVMQCIKAADRDCTDDADDDDALASVADQEFAAPSFNMFLQNNQQQLGLQPLMLQQEQQQQQDLSSCWQGSYSQLPAAAAPLSAAAAAADTLTLLDDRSISRSSSSSRACRNAAHDAVPASKTNRSKAGSSSSSSGSRSKSGVRSYSGPLRLSSGPASANTVTPLGCGWTCVMSRSSPAVQAAAAQPGSEQRQLRQQEPGSSMAQQAGEDISLGGCTATCCFLQALR